MSQRGRSRQLQENTGLQAWGLRVPPSSVFCFAVSRSVPLSLIFLVLILEDQRQGINRTECTHRAEHMTAGIMSLKPCDVVTTASYQLLCVRIA